VHNGQLPVNIEHFGRIARLDRITVIHDGWNTLRKRLAKVDLYHTLDPDGQYNCGVPYDEGLLFGYKAHLMGLAAYPLVERSQSARLCYRHHRHTHR
jgi:hypothetical protein